MDQKPVTPVTPLRRSERIRRPTTKAIGSSPGSSPGTAIYVGRSIPSRSRAFVPDRQTDSDTTLRNTTSPRSSGSSTEGTVGDAADSMALVASFPPEVYQAYQGLAPMLYYSDAVFTDQDVPTLKAYSKELDAFLRKVVMTGHSLIWPEFEDFLGLCGRIKAILASKKSPRKPKMRKNEGMGNVPGAAMGSKWVPVSSAEYSEETWQDTADTESIQHMYRNAANPSNLGRDDVGAGEPGSGVQVTDVLGYSLSYPWARTLDYCTLADSYRL